MSVSVLRDGSQHGTVLDVPSNHTGPLADRLKEIQTRTHSEILCATGKPIKQRYNT